ncbi:2-methylisocitrate lyase [Streptomyces sp. YIM 130001]|uniref:isocitrate lyase/phosphoenolpyruvate mutase family protein n=1 Tax=Streptomyces sp. YIM 130001 TaxID=2259644 RepID=UPI000E647693|nr:isocitrate lyase/phosphoenolpyruvate mutase family protein [Streptomyces sp. YIM 130001]RII16036.1 2-methylisocitrate lyase [Streptomyces sp. YIM 130001]
MTQTTHEFDRADDVRAALADPALAPELPATDGGETGASVGWLRATAARFSTGAAHRRRRALVEAELASLDADLLRRAATEAPPGDLRTRVVRTLATALGMPDPATVAEDVVVSRAYFRGTDPAADAAVERLVRLLAPEAADADPLESGAQRIGLLVQACEATAALVEAADADTDADADAVPLAHVLRRTPPVRTMRRLATLATRLGGRDIAEGDLVLLDVATAGRTHPVPLAFGAPPRVCPGRTHALALADGLLGRPLTPFAALHHRNAPLLLPNAWDHASAAALAAAGFAAVGTTSLGVAAAAGLRDGEAATAGATLSLARLLGQDTFLFSVDAEGGFSDDVAEVAELARKLHAAGASGINIEDGRPDGTLAPVDLHAAKIAAAKAAAPGLFVNARTDTHWLGTRREETAERLARYEQAGADGVFAPGLTDRDAIVRLVSGLVTPLNVLYSPTGPTVAELAACGVRRISLGSLLYRSALAAAVTTATAVRDSHRPPGPDPLPYADVQHLAR